MPTWRDAVLRHFEYPVPLTLVADPDGLLQEESVLAQVQAQGYDVVVYGDPLAFRYLYETQYRAAWDARQTTRPLVVRTAASDVNSLPYDVLQQGRRVALSLHDLFPQLSYPVVGDFFRAAPALLDTLVAAYRSYEGPRLGDLRSLAYIARHVYRLDPDAIADLDDLVERVLTVHYHGWPLSPRLRAWLAEQLGGRPAFQALPVETWLAEPPAFFAYLEEQWAGHLQAQGLTLAEAQAHAVGSAVDFNRPGIRALVDTLFLASRLRPVRVVAERPPADWAAVGVAVDQAAGRRRRLADLLTYVEQRLPAADALHRAWLDLAAPWAEVNVLARSQPLADLAPRFSALQTEVTARFPAWLQTHYGALHSLPFVTAPVLGHRVPEFLAYHQRRTGGRVALLVLDGLALDQWTVLREVWQAQGRPWRTVERALFAVLPTVTPIARQALFAGQLPLYFADTWRRTDQDGPRWGRFWVNQGLFPSAVAWRLGTDDLAGVLADDRVQALGLVVGTVDEMVHGTVAGLAELHARVRHWAEQGALAETVAALLAARFRVWLTSDHGNVEAQGLGRPAEGSLVEQRGSRVRVYTEPSFLARAQAEVPAALAWTPGGLPADLLTLFAPDRRAFAPPGAALVTHGGLTLEEVVVPWVEITPAEDTV